MNQQKIAILVDSGCDVPAAFVRQHGLYVLPLQIVFSEKTYQDGIDMTSDQLYARLETEIPKTSLPSGQQIAALLEKIKADGYDKVIAVTISSRLSGTHNAIRLIADEMPELKTFVLDTRNISIGAGFHAMAAVGYIAQGLSFEEIVSRLQAGLEHSKVFFCVRTLDYLQKGGRIGLVAALLGNLLHLKPIISCNPDGVYYTAAKVRGRINSLNKLIDCAQQYAALSVSYDLAILQTQAQQEIDAIKGRILDAMPAHDNLYWGEISACLGVHVGPGLIGVGVYQHG